MVVPGIQESGCITVAEVVWAVLRQNGRFLLAQRSILDCFGGTWTIPGGKIDPEDVNDFAAVHRELKEEVGLEGRRFLKLFHMHLGQYRVQVFLCDQWNGEPKPACADIMGVGWFTGTEMYALDKSLSPFVNDSLLYLSYLMQHYDHHPDEWKEQWRTM